MLDWVQQQQQQQQQEELEWLLHQEPIRPTALAVCAAGAVHTCPQSAAPRCGRQLVHHAVAERRTCRYANLLSWLLRMLPPDSLQLARHWPA